MRQNIKFTENKSINFMILYCILYRFSVHLLIDMNTYDIILDSFMLKFANFIVN